MKYSIENNAMLRKAQDLSASALEGHAINEEEQYMDEVMARDWWSDDDSLLDDEFFDEDEDEDEGDACCA